MGRNMLSPYDARIYMNVTDTRRTATHDFRMSHMFAGDSAISGQRPAGNWQQPRPQRSIIE